MARILVTGGGGFLGKHVVQRLSLHDVFAPTSKELQLYNYASVRDVFANFRPELVVHLAAKVSGISGNIDSPYDLLYYNSLINLNVCNAARLYTTKILAAGSVCMYSDDASLPWQEEDIFVGRPEISNIGYGESKRLLLSLLESLWRQYETSYTMLVLSNLYGPGDNFDEHPHVIPDLIKKISSRQPFSIRGDGSNTRDFLYVEDAADAFVIAIDSMLIGHSSHHVYNVSTNTTASVNDIIKMVSSIYGLMPSYTTTELYSGQKLRSVDSSKFNNAFWRIRKYSLFEGLRKTIEWYESTGRGDNVR